MSEPTVVVVDGGESAAVQAAEEDATAEVALAAGAAVVMAENAEECAQEAEAVAETALAVAEAAHGSCCEHCVTHAARLDALEEGRAAELEAALAMEELDAPAPEIREEKPKREAPKKAPEPAPKRGFWPL